MGQRRERSNVAAGIASATALIGLIGSAIVLPACNTNPVEYATAGSVLVKEVQTPIGGQVPMDILWVIDNSFSMCQEQKILRDNFGLFVQQIEKTNLDFHIGVTTTHAPESEFVIEPLAREAFIQSTPQPVPGNNESCLRGEGTVNGQVTSFAPFRESLEVAKSCLADPNTASTYNWTDAQIQCALLGAMQQTATNCVADTGLVDRDGNSAIDTFDLFPLTSEYRVIDKVLKASDYKDANGNLNAEKLRLDFACMSTVGTRGDGYEKGLRAAVKSISPEFTGGAFGLNNSDATKPNHGLIRKDAGFALIFVTDENDCSHNGNMTELGNMCGNNVCEYYNSTAVNEADSPLISPESFAQQLRENLAATKGIAATSLNEDNILMASIHGTFNRSTMPFPTCGPGMNPEIAPVCASELGEAFSGDRYERFIRQFQNYYPRQNTTEETRLDFSIKEFGWMCSDTFAPALEAIGAFIGDKTSTCIVDKVQICQSDDECPGRIFTDQPGSCVPFPPTSERAGEGYCDSGIVLALERDPSVADADTQYAAIADNPYCLQESIGNLNSSDSCIVDPSNYTWGFCGNNESGIEYTWKESTAAVVSKLAGYTLKTIYSVSVDE